MWRYGFKMMVFGFSAALSAAAAADEPSTERLGIHNEQQSIVVETEGTMSSAEGLGASRLPSF
jgi:hypothetical protein